MSKKLTQAEVTELKVNRNNTTGKATAITAISRAEVFTLATFSALDLTMSIDFLASRLIDHLNSLSGANEDEADDGSSSVSTVIKRKSLASKRPA